MTPHCATCQFWDVREPETPEYIGTGICRRWPPAPSPDATTPGLDQYRRSFEKRALWATTLGTDWCGEWRAHEHQTKEAVCGGG